MKEEGRQCVKDGNRERRYDLNDSEKRRGNEETFEKVFPRQVGRSSTR